MASVFDVLSDKISEVAFDYMRNTNVDPFEDILASEKVLQQVFNWDKDMANKVMKQAAVIMDGLRGNVDNFTDSMKAVAGRFEMTELKKNMDDFYAGNRDVYKSQEDMIADAEKKFKEMGIGGKELDTALLVFSQGGSLFFDMLEDIKQGTFDLKKAEDYALKVSAKQAPVIETEMADKQLDELIKQTTPLADYLEIGKEGAMYTLAGSDLQRNISLGVTATARYAGDIFKWMTRHERKATKFELSTYEKNVAMREHLSKASEMYAAAGDTAGVESVKDELDTAIKYIETFESTFKGSSSEMKAIVNKVSRDDKLLSGNRYAENIRKIIEIDKELAEKSGQQLSDEEKLALKTKKAGLLFASKHRLSQIRPDYSLYDQPPPKLAHAEPADAEPADVKPVTGLLEFFKVFKDKSEPADVKPVKVSKDKSVTKGGVLLAETGDLVVSNRNQAKGVDGNRGQMFNSAQSIIRTKGGGGGSSFSIGNISLSFNAPLNGKPEDYKKVFVQAVTDIVNKRLYEDKMKVKTA